MKKIIRMAFIDGMFIKVDSIDVTSAIVNDCNNGFEFVRNDGSNGYCWNQNYFGYESYWTLSE